MNANRYEPCTYLIEDETGKHKYDCEVSQHPDTNRVIENCFQDQACCRNRVPRIYREDEYPETKVGTNPLRNPDIDTIRKDERNKVLSELEQWIVEQQPITQQLTEGLFNWNKAVCQEIYWKGVQRCENNMLKKIKELQNRGKPEEK